VKELVDLLRGETAVLYGQPMVGKTLSTIVLGKFLKQETKKPAFYIWSDANLLGKYGEFLKKVSGGVVEYAKNPRDLDIALRKLKHKIEVAEECPYSMIVIDSVTGFQESIMAREGIDSPRTALLLGRLSQLIARELRILAVTYDIPTVMIAHQTAIFNPNAVSLGPFAGKDRKPTIVTKALRNVTLLIYMYIDPEKNKPVWLIEDIRSNADKIQKFPKGTAFELDIKVR